MYVNETIDNLNPFWNADYARVYFTFKPKDGLGYPKGDLVIFGQLSNYGDDPDALMTFNADKGIYEGSMLLKQGYYDYQYAIRTEENGKRFTIAPFLSRMHGRLKTLIWCWYTTANWEEGQIS